MAQTENLPTLRVPEFVPVDHVVDGIYISGWRATLHFKLLREAGLRHILKLYADIPTFPADFDTFENALDDGKFVPKDVLERGVEYVIKQVEARQPVLVMCAAGMSRSATFVLASLIERGYDLRDAWSVLYRARPVVTPHPRMWESLLMHYQLDYTLEEVWHWRETPAST